MTSTDAPVTWTLAGFRYGVVLSLPIIPAMTAFGLAVGATAARQGLTFLDNLLMNVFVFAGMSQLIAMEAWPDEFTPAALAALALMCLTVNARMFLMGAALQPWLGAASPWRIYPLLHLLTDVSWLIAMRYRGNGGADAGVFLGASVFLALVWVAATMAGHLGGSLVVDPRRYGIDLVMPIFFAAMLVPLWHGPRRAIPWAVAAATAIAVHRFAGGWWFIVAGALAGSAAAGLIDDGE